MIDSFYLKLGRRHMKRYLLLTLLLPLLVGCNPTNGDNTIFKAGQNVQTRNYKNIEADEIHPEVDDGYVRISSVLIDSEFFVDAAEDITYLYKLSCKDSEDSFQTHRFICDDDGEFVCSSLLSQVVTPSLAEEASAFDSSRVFLCFLKFVLIRYLLANQNQPYTNLYSITYLFPFLQIIIPTVS